MKVEKQKVEKLHVWKCRSQERQSHKEGSMFHAQDGWFFERDATYGSVRIIKRESARDDAPVVAEVLLDKHSWASIIASMSKEGETTEKSNKAQEFHGFGR